MFVYTGNVCIGLLIIFASGIIPNNGSTKEVAAMLHGPRFTIEPPSRLILSGGSGAKALCSARGSPQPHISWVTSEGTPLLHVSGLRHIVENGTLIFPPFQSSRYRHDIHSTSYRCRATNKLGTIVSKEMKLTTIIEEHWEPIVGVSQVQSGGTAVLTCNVIGPKADYTSVQTWYRNNDVIIATPSDSGGRYVNMPETKILVVRGIMQDDVAASYTCETLDSLSGVRKRSQPAYITLQDLTRISPPHITTQSSDLAVKEGSDVHIVCSAVAHPLPSYSWYRVSNGGPLIPINTNLRVSINQEILYIRMVEAEDDGKYICKAYNQHGEQTQETKLTVISRLTVDIKPHEQVANYGSTVNIQCVVSGSPAPSVRWYHNGLPSEIDGDGTSISFGTESGTHLLMIRRMDRKERGMYQCVANNGREEAQDSSQLELGDFAPELQYTFIEQALHQGPLVSLKCSASGTPPPTFVWLLDDQIISDFNPGHGIMVDQRISEMGNVESHLNISSARTEDGGRYTCRAANAIGSTEHTARLNIYGM